ncbi:hypothetical protein FG478_00820, partial [Xylella fastidiosa subsp. multiplex]|nr:hypothetical protein [Xylella fastidiosa subsp. multiplex]
INRFLQIERPQFKRLPRSAKKINSADMYSTDYIIAQLRRGKKPYYPSLDDPILSAVVGAISHMNDIQRFEVTPTERGIVLFEAARKAMKQA